MITPDHPLRFSPLFRSYIWGGNRLATQLGKTPPNEGIWAESWEVIDHPDAESVVANGPLAGQTIRSLMSSFPAEMMGSSPDSRDSAERFPILLKYLDCQRDLSVQVHPNDEYGAKMPKPDRGKTEAWYVIDAEPGAILYAGLKAGVTREDLIRSLAAGTTADLLHVLKPRAGDCVFIPAGTVHALGAGLLVAEIQQASDCTFRLFDWNRVDRDGKPRELHIEQALEVIDVDSGPREFVRPKDESTGWRTLVECDKFCLYEAKEPRHYAIPAGQVALLTVPRGQAALQYGSHNESLRRGETLFLPASKEPIELELGSNAVALLATLPG
jgi:mannose-6-phosphate isomerase